MEWNKLLSANRLSASHGGADIRSAFQHDYDRIVFSTAFRRLQNKTQVFPLPGSQIVHNRLTHSIEVASVGRSIACMVSSKLADRFGNGIEKQLANIDIIVSTACLAHDLGNPPFGHSGEESISSYFRDDEGRKYEQMVSPAQWHDLIAFEGNANAIRILAHQFRGRRAGGLSLTSATLATLIKYPYPSFENGNRKKYNVFCSELDIFDRFMTDCGINAIDAQRHIYARHPLSYMMEAADDICYLFLDMEDAHKRSIIDTQSVENYFSSFFNPLTDTQFFDYKEQVYQVVTDTNERIAFLRAQAISKLVDCVSTVFVDHYNDIINGNFKGGLISHLPEFQNSALNKCRNISVSEIYKHSSVVKIELEGYKILGYLMSAFTDAVMNPDKSYNRKLITLIPDQFIAETEDVYTKLQTMTDYISNMTDLYAVQLYKDLNGIN